MDTIKGYIENIVFQNQENGFTVAKLKENNKNFLITIVGCMPSVQPGETLQLEGEWKSHPNFGKQFDVKEYKITSPADLIGIQKYLESGLVKGIGPVYAEKIVHKFGTDTLDIIEKTPRRLQEVPGIGKKRIEKIIECFDEQKAIRDIIIFLRTYGISPTYAQKIYKIYGDKTIDNVKINPYTLARDITGIGFKIADNIAKNMGFELDSPLRISSGIEYVLHELTLQGHTCYPLDDFLPSAENILEVDEKLILKELQKLLLDNQITQEELLIDGIKTNCIWLKSLYNFEKTIAYELHRINTCPQDVREIDLEKALLWVQEKQNIQLAEKQKEAIKQAILEKVHIITGGPGTGKSTIVNAILEIYKMITNKIFLAAPTGRAAKRLTEITHKKAFTIHCLLEFDFSSKGFKKCENNPLKCDLIIIDEASMIDTFLMNHLLKALPSYTKIIFVGDIDQLPSVGPGYVLKDLIASEKIGYTKLSEIYRQAKDSQIILNAHKINSGLFPEISQEKDSDFLFYPITDVEEIQKKILKLVEKELPKKRNLHPVNDIQVLSPMKKGKIGIENLNMLLQNALNPSPKPLFRAGSRFHEQDKVMQIKNNYNKNVFNGDIGRIIKIDTIEQQVIVAFEENTVNYEFSELDELTLSYAVSVHKYQGSECPCIIIPIHTTHFKLLYRNLIYTAITRGKQLVVVLGTTKAVAIAVKNNEVIKRFTGLKHALKQEKSISQETMLPGFNS